MVSLLHERPEKLLWRAVERCNLDEVKAILYAPSSSTSSSSSSFSSTSSIVSSIASPLVCYAPLDINWGNFDSYNFTALHLACTKGDPSIIQELLRHPNIEVNRLDGNEMTAFMLSCQVGRVKPLKVLLADKRVLVDLFTPRGSTGIWYASCFGKAQAVMAIFASEREINVETKGKHYDGRMLTPAGIAAVNKQHDLAELLEDFAHNPEKVRFEAKMALTQRGKHLAAHLFALVIFQCDSYLRFTSSSLPEEDVRVRNVKRFFASAEKLPLELQMILCNRAYRIMRDLIPTKDSEPAFRFLACVGK